MSPPLRRRVPGRLRLLTEFANLHPPIVAVRPYRRCEGPVLRRYWVRERCAPELRLVDDFGVCSRSGRVCILRLLESGKSGAVVMVVMCGSFVMASTTSNRAGHLR